MSYMHYWGIYLKSVLSRVTNCRFQISAFSFVYGILLLFFSKIPTIINVFIGIIYIKNLKYIIFQLLLLQGLCFWFCKHEMAWRLSQKCLLLAKSGIFNNIQWSYYIYVYLTPISFKINLQDTIYKDTNILTSNNIIVEDMSRYCDIILGVILE